MLGIEYARIQKLVRRNGYQLSVQMTTQPKGAVSIYPIPDDQAGACSPVLMPAQIHFNLEQEET